MKLFSRKALVAGATAVAVAFAGTSVATAGEQTPLSASPNLFSMSSGEDGEGGFSSSNKKPDDGDGSSVEDAESIAAWFSVFTAIVGALTAAFSFATKYLGFKI